MKNKKKRSLHLGVMTIFFVLMELGVMIVTLLLCVIVFAILVHTGVISNTNMFHSQIWKENRMIFTMVALIIFCVVLGALFAGIWSYRPLKPINDMLKGLEKLSNGDYNIRLEPVKRGIGKKIITRFNLLAAELENTELLRSDFINNFSHEFKTPIVSIQGFAKLMQKGNLTKEREEEYLKIIVEESTRLSEMSTNILYMTKLENQNILSEVTKYNLSEQIRTCILLLEKEWEKKQIEIEADFLEYQIHANEEMLREVWINLLGNAIKFCNKSGKITVTIQKDQENAKVMITNTGSTISKENQNRVFQKFYQVDESHASRGNGIGLAIVKRIVDLHQGTVKVESENEETSFILTLPTE